MHVHACVLVVLFPWLGGSYLATNTGSLSGGGENEPGFDPRSCHAFANQCPKMCPFRQIYTKVTYPATISAYFSSDQATAVGCTCLERCHHSSLFSTKALSTGGLMMVKLEVAACTTDTPGLVLPSSNGYDL